MRCNTEWTGQFLKQHFSDAFIKGDLRKHTSTIMLQQQVAMLPATQPAVEQQIIYEQYANEVKDINRQIRELVARGIKTEMETEMETMATASHYFNTSVVIPNVADSFRRRGNVEPAANSHARSATK
jgi:phosphatidylserine/phosphatidylglycerophosphate/cardiolipin synthase-like enzyme